MKLNNRRSRHSGPKLPLVLVFVALAALAGYRLNLFATANPSPARGAIASTSAAIPTARPTATLAPTPTATPIPAPTKKPDAAAPPAVSAVSAVVLDEQSGAIFYEKNAHMHRAPASITKIVTAIVAIEHTKPTDMVDAKYDSSELVDSTLMGLYPNDRISMEDLLYGLLLPSGNDAALAIANYVAGSESAFADMMNQKMADLGLHDSHFVNAHGLDADGHYTSAYDMAMVSRYAMQDPLFRKIVAARSHTVTLWRGGTKMTYDIYNLNKLLTTYPGGDGVKVGYTENALKTFVGSATQNRHRVYVVLMGSTDLWSDSPPLLDYAFKNFEWPN